MTNFFPSEGRGRRAFSGLILLCAAIAAAAGPASSIGAAAAAGDRLNLVFCCAADNDLYRVLTAAAEYSRHESAIDAAEAASQGAGVLILADGYPQQTTSIDTAVFDLAAKKNLRLYVEYPASLPETEIGSPRRTGLERAVVASDAFGPVLERLQILAIHDCHFVPVKASQPHLVLARVAGFDRAVFGLQDVETEPILFEHSRGDILVSTTKLSQFVTARYAPKEAVQNVWRMVLGWLQPGRPVPELDWIPTVRPSYGPKEPLPPDVVRGAIVRAIDFHTKARLLIHDSWKEKYRGSHPARPNPAWPSGDGEHGVLEGFVSRIAHDGSQPARWWLRSDSNGETSLAFALRSKLDGDERSRRIAGNLLDWVYFNSGLFQRDPAKANFGLVHWAPDNSALYGDNDIKIILGCLGTAAVLEDDRWDEVLLQNILGNFRTTGACGFRGNRLSDAALLRQGWQSYWRGRRVNFAPHYEAWLWASYLWLYDKTRDELLLSRTRNALRTMMDAYPDGWRWTNGIQQERGRMLLPLAWLVRVDDRPEHRAWLKQLATDMERCQDACGAIREELGELGRGQYRPPQSNAEYGRHEASLIQQNGDPVADMLYTCNFTMLGLHEAYAATDDEQYRRMADRLAEFLVRIQIRSDAHPELDGGWFRGFDFRRWEYFGSNADSGWGAWCIEVGWTQAWITSVLAMRELGVNLWDLSRDSKVSRHWEKTRRMMLPEDAIEEVLPQTVDHAGRGRPVRLHEPADPRYAAHGPKSLTDGELGPADHVAAQWLGFWGEDIEATVDLGQPQPVRRLAARFLQSTAVGIFLPPKVVFEVSDDGQQFRRAAVVDSKVSPREPGPLVRELVADDLAMVARYVRVRAENVGTIPDGHPARGRKAWLFVDETMVNPAHDGTSQ